MTLTLEEIKAITVVGAGTMGQGIAQICALAGYKTRLYDVKEEVLSLALHNIERNLEKGLEKGKLNAADKDTCLSNIELVKTLEKVKAELVIEAVLESLTIKQDIFEKLEKTLSPSVIFATNTSSIPITRIAAALKYPERLVGMHFFNPAHIMKLVEVISGAATGPDCADVVTKLAVRLGKVPVQAKDAPGFIVNRVARHFYVEALKMLEEGVAEIQTIDDLVRAAGFKMGPFELMDLIGVDTNFAVTSSMFDAFHQEPKFRPSRIQQQKVEAGHWGRKSGKGFYDYE